MVVFIPGKVEVRAVKGPQAQVVVGVVVDADQPFGAVGIGERPRPGTAP